MKAMKLGIICESALTVILLNVQSSEYRFLAPTHVEIQSGSYIPRRYEADGMTSLSYESSELVR